MAKFKVSLKKLSLMKSRDIIPEDSIKRKIFLIIPSERQLGIVKGRWNEWAWKDKTYTGECAPLVSGWIKDVLSIRDALKSEGIETIIFTDNTIIDKVREFTSSSEVKALDIPPYLAKIGYVRDQSVTWFNYPIIGNMALDIRRGEEAVINEVYEVLRLPPLVRARWEEVEGKLVRAKMEGGNFIVIRSDDRSVILTGIGVRGSNTATFKFLAEILPSSVELYGVPLAGYIRDWKFGAAHLDVVFYILVKLMVLNMHL